MNKDNFKEFKKLFYEDLVWVFDKGTDKDEIVDMIYESDMNYNNADPTSCQEIYSHKDISEFVDEIEERGKIEK